MRPLNIKKEFSDSIHTCDANMNAERFELPVFEDDMRIDALTASDLSSLLPVFNDEAVMYYYLPDRMRTFNAHELSDLLADWHDGKTSFVFAIRVKHELIGMLTCEAYDPDQRHAEIGIMLLSRHRGRGLATKAARLFIRTLFNQANLHRISARVIEGNHASVTLFKRLGFRLEGRQREQVRRGTQYLDMLLFGLLRHEWVD